MEKKLRISMLQSVFYVCNLDTWSKRQKVQYVLEGQFWSNSTLRNTKNMQVKRDLDT